MKKTLTYIILLVCSISSAQDSFYSTLNMGNYQVGFFDTLIYGSEVSYDQYGYKGPSPLFVQVWHPIKSNVTSGYLTYGDFRNQKAPVSLASVYENLNRQADAVFMEANIATALSTYENIDYGSFSYEDVYNKLKLTKTKSIRAEPSKKTNFPVIVYHHGTQGISDENYIMAEYFASKGYIFVSANYHLPYSQKIYGLAESTINDPANIKAVIAFSKTLSKNKHTFFVGHSWGAQTGWCFLHEPEWASGFVSLETTIEFKSDTASIKEMWPFVYETIRTKKSQYNLPILMFANTQEDKPFAFFEGCALQKLYSVSSKAFFEHNSYTSVYLMRYFLRTLFNQPDTEILGDQIKIYSLHLRMMDDFFQSVLHKKQLNPDKYKGDFFFN